MPALTMMVPSSQQRHVNLYRCFNLRYFMHTTSANPTSSIIFHARPAAAAVCPINEVLSVDSKAWRISKARKRRRIWLEARRVSQIALSMTASSMPSGSPIRWKDPPLSNSTPHLSGRVFSIKTSPAYIHDSKRSWISSSKKKYDNIETLITSSATLCMISSLAFFREHLDIQDQFLLNALAW